MGNTTPTSDPLWCPASDPLPPLEGRIFYLKVSEPSGVDQGIVCTMPGRRNLHPRPAVVCGPEGPTYKNVPELHLVAIFCEEKSETVAKHRVTWSNITLFRLAIPKMAGV